MPIARGLSLRLFLEGEEIPVVSASVNASINAPATASIQIVPLDEAMDFKPRTMVHLFYLDDKPTSNNDVDYKCLFVGETVGFSYVQSPQGRGLVLQCLDHSSYWDAANATAIEYGPGGNAFFPHGSLIGADISLIDDIISHPEVKLLSWIKQKPLTPGLSNITGLTKGIIRIMEAMGGVITSSTGKRHKGVNDFFTVSELMCHVLSQVASEEGDDTAAKILNLSVLENWLKNSLESLGQQVTFRDILKLLMSRIFYDVVPNPTPRWTPTVTSSSTSKAGITVSSVTQQRLRTQIIRPDCWFVAPPKCNVMFPEQYTQLSYDRNFLGEATRAYIQLASFITGTEELFSRKVVVPNIGLESKSLTSFSGEEAYRHLMTHEQHTGIVLKTEMIPDYMVVEKSRSTEEKTKISDERISWIKRAAMFHFFKYRFGPRTLNLSGRFNPNVVCGFPGVVILKPFNIDPNRNIGTQDIFKFVQTTADSLGAPNQLVGMIIGLHHTIDQSGGTTSISMTHVRKHKGIDDEFLNVLVTDPNDSKKYHLAVPLELNEIITSNNKQLLKLMVDLTSQSVHSDASSITKTTVVNKNYTQITNTSSGATISDTPVTTAVYTETTIAPKSPIITSTNVKFSDGTSQEMEIPSTPGAKGKGDTGLIGGTIVAVEVVDSTIVTTSLGKAFGSILLHEELVVPNTPVPFEELVRPDWFASLYNNKNIGPKIYNPIIGCGSVVDGLTVNGLILTDVPPLVTVPSNFTSADFKDYITTLRATNFSQSTEIAINVVANTYFNIKSSQLDVDNFIKQYTQRSIATKEQLLGSSNLQFKIDNYTVTPQSSDGKSFTIGFHSMTVHPQIVEASKTNRLVGLTTDPDTGFKRIDDHGKAAPIDKTLDVRWEKRQKVLFYKVALQSHAFQG